VKYLSDLNKILADSPRTSLLHDDAVSYAQISVEHHVVAEPVRSACGSGQFEASVVDFDDEAPFWMAL